MYEGNLARHSYFRRTNDEFSRLGSVTTTQQSFYSDPQVEMLILCKVSSGTKRLLGRTLHRARTPGVRRTLRARPCAHLPSHSLMVLKSTSEKPGPCEPASFSIR